MLWKNRKERLQIIKQKFIDQNKLEIFEAQMKSDKDWDIRGTVYCPGCDKYLDECFSKFEKCECEKEERFF